MGSSPNLESEDKGSSLKESAKRRSSPKESADKERIPKKSENKGSSPKESYPFPLMSKGERMRRCKETERKIGGIKTKGAMVTRGA